jgi:PBS lyase HEAT-like repeat
MHKQRLPWIIATLLVSASMNVMSAWGDSFLLKSGGRLEGEWLNPKRKPEDPYELTTLEGLQLTLPKDQVAKVFVKTNIEREYERHVPGMPNTAEGHWKMSEWCREVGLRTKREFHLKEVVRLNPEHAEARTALGYQLYDGVWRTPEQHMATQGYVRYQGRWLTPQDVALAKQEEIENGEIVAWRQKIRLWKSWLGKKRDLEARENFRTIHDPHAGQTLIETLEETDNGRDLRLLALQALALLEGRPGESCFIRLAVEDPDAKIREKCTDVLVQYESLRAVMRCSALLKHEENLLVNRAAQVLGQLKAPQAVPALIEALITTHEITIIPGSASAGGLGPMTNSFARDGAGNVMGNDSGGGGGMTFGSPRPRKEKREVQNDAVLGALTATVPGVNYAFNEAAWRKWFIQEHEPAKLDLRRAE